MPRSLSADSIERGLLVGAVQHRDLLGSDRVALEELLDLGADEAGLDVGVGGDDDLDAVLGLARGDERLLVAAAAALGEHRVGDVEHRSNRAVVVLQLDDARAREVLLEVEDVAHVGAAPGVDGLVVVADDHHVAVRAADEPRQLELGAVGVLVLVDDDLAEARLPALEDVGTALEEAHHLADEVVEVERLEAAQRGLVARVDEHGQLVVVVDALAVPLRLLPLLGGEEGVLGVGDARQDGGRRRSSSRSSSRGGSRGRRRSDRPGRRWRRPCRAGPSARVSRAEHVEAEAVEGGDGELLGDLAVDQGDDALAHLGGGLVGERDREDGRRGSAALDQPGDAVGDDARLARAGAREHEHGPGQVLDGGLLRGVEAGGHDTVGTAGGEAGGVLILPQRDFVAKPASRHPSSRANSPSLRSRRPTARNASARPNWRMCPPWKTCSGAPK